MRKASPPQRSFLVSKLHGQPTVASGGRGGASTGPISSCSHGAVGQEFPAPTKVNRQSTDSGHPLYSHFPSFMDDCPALNPVSLRNPQVLEGEVGREPPYGDRSGEPISVQPWPVFPSLHHLGRFPMVSQVCGHAGKAGVHAVGCLIDDLRHVVHITTAQRLVPIAQVCGT